jgi:hypothetical protein
MAKELLDSTIIPSPKTSTGARHVAPIKYVYYNVRKTTYSTMLEKLLTLQC